jgi:hypothetical protein
LSEIYKAWYSINLEELVFWSEMHRVSLEAVVALEHVARLQLERRLRGYGGDSQGRGQKGRSQKHAFEHF